LYSGITTEPIFLSREFITNIWTQNQIKKPRILQEISQHWNLMTEWVTVDTMLVDLQAYTNTHALLFCFFSAVAKLDDNWLMTLWWQSFHQIPIGSSFWYTGTKARIYRVPRRSTSSWIVTCWYDKGYRLNLHNQ